jgi:hypothetical protein
MQLAQRIKDQVQALPEEIQREVLDFVEYLNHKLQTEETTWSALSFSSALRGLEDENWPEYLESDYLEKWQ